MLCAAVSGKLFAKSLRSSIAPALSNRAGDGQPGAISGGGTLAPSTAVGLFLERARRAKQPAAVLLADMKAAFHTAMPELTLGRLLLGADRAAWLAHLCFNANEVQRFAAGHVEGLPLLQ